jgi:alpha-glucosidase
MQLALNPHHDGSSLYVSNQSPKLHDRVKLKIRTHESLGQIVKVSARQSENGEAFFSKRAKPTAGDDGWLWWEMSIEMVNPSVGYRFLIELADGDCYWLNTLGITQIEPMDVFDFRINVHSDAPSWAASSVMYQIFPDRFAKSAAADSREVPSWAIKKQWSDPVSGTGEDVGKEFFGGDLDGIVEHLDHLEQIGVDIVYLTPIFPAESNHRYDASSFDLVDELLGGDEALKRLVEAAHSKGMKVMGDLTSNHSGKEHEWFKAAYKNPTALESDFYYFSEGNTKYVCWWDVPSLPKFNWKSKELRKRFIEGEDSVVAKWLKPPFNLDGWRIDVANMTGRLGE